MTEFAAGLLIGSLLGVIGGICIVVAIRWAIDFGGDMLVEWTRKGRKWL